MPSKPKAAIPPTSTSHLFARQSKAKDQSRSMTSETIADDLAAFRKQGGRVEVLGITPLRMHMNVSTSRSKTTATKAVAEKSGTSASRTQRKAGTAAATGKAAAAR
ncbi:MAG: hypothetical protein L0H23_05235 [Luteimonas sp.]|nr:hypothetical protein [Luteimonas sp.]